MNDIKDYNKLKKTYNIFSKYYKIPLVNENDINQSFTEKYLDYEPYKKWSVTDKRNALNQVLSNQKRMKDSNEFQAFTTKELIEKLNFSVKNKKIKEKIIKLVPRKNSNDLWEIIPSHGDMNFNNILKSNNTFYFIDWEDAHEAIFIYDFINIIFVEAMYQNDYSLLNKYLAGEFDSMLKSFFNCFSLEYNKNHKYYYIALYIIERITQFEIIDNEGDISTQLLLYEEVLDRIL